MPTAVWFRSPRNVELGPVDVAAAGPGDVVVRTVASGISAGTELLLYRGQVDQAIRADEQLSALGESFAYPLRYGYSCVGRVEQAGADLAAGQLVFAFHPHQDRFVVAGRDVIPLDGNVDARTATLLPLVETALQVALDAGEVRHEPVVVSGLGPVGLLTAVLLGRSGARVVGSEPQGWRRALARGAGIDAVDPSELGEAVGDLSEGRGVPLVVECSGNPGALAAAVDLLAHEGTALVASWYGTKPVTLPLGGAFHRRRLAVRSTQVSTVPASLGHRWDVARRRAVARRLLSELPLGSLATHTYPFADAAAAYRDLDDAKEGLFHAALWYP